MDDADVDMVVRSCMFAAVGTQGQRCTTLRRLIVHPNLYEEVIGKLAKAYTQVRIGDPLEGKFICSLYKPETSEKLSESIVSRELW